ncbi:PAS-domain containing protein [Kiloniella antarctica]|uniref:histidine kinase n=1 Tax=Kiloniella antarctica TaxID=1550907 RepID=A0ABW5BHF1_9PROT
MLKQLISRYGLSRLQMKLLTITVPAFLLLGTIFVTAIEVSLFVDEKGSLEKKLERVTKTFIVIVAEPLWNVDIERTASILGAMSIDEDFVSAIVYDDEGIPFATIGKTNQERTPALTTQQQIIYTPEMEQQPRVIGTLVINFTDENLLATTYHRVATVISLATLFAFVLIFTNIYVHRKFVGTPLQRMLALIRQSSEKPAGQRVEWSSDDEIGVVTTAFNKMLDIQERYYEELEVQVKNRTQELSEKSELLELTLSNLRGGLVVYDAQGQMLIWNDRYFEIFNLPDRFRRVGQDYAEIIRYDVELCLVNRDLDNDFDVDNLIQNRLDSFVEGRKETVELCFTDGRIIEARRNPMPGGGQICSYIDITTRKRAEEHMIEKEAQLRAVLDNIPGGIRYVDVNRNNVFFNAQYSELYGLPDDLLKIGDSIQTENLYQAKRGDFGPGDPEELSKAWLKKLPVLVEPQSWERITTHGKVLEVHTTPTPNGGVINVVTDITKRKQSVEELRKAKEVAELANRSKSDFLAAMSHELRTPLNAIIGFSTMIKDQMLGPNKAAVYAEYGADILNSGLHLLGLINDLLDLSKIEAGKLELNFDQLDTQKAILDNIRTVDPLAEKSEVKLTINLQDNLPSIIADQRAFDQIILNVMSNAIKFTPPGGQVTVSVSAVRDNTQIIISDTGVGIEPKDLDKVMKPWGQIIDPLKADHKGSGLGLPIVKSLIDLHGGKLSLESKVGMGTSITITLSNSGPDPK